MKSKNILLTKLLLLHSNISQKNKNNIVNAAGFTLVELLITILIIGILFAISANTWTAFLNQQRISQANQKVFSVIQETKTKSQKRNQAYTLSFRENSGRVQYAISLKNATPSEGEWQDLFNSNKESIELSFYSPDNTAAINDLKTQTFNYQGVPEDTSLDVNKRIIISPKDGSFPNKSSKCVIVQDLLGTLRIESDDRCTKDDSNNDISGSITPLS